MIFCAVMGRLYLLIHRIVFSFRKRRSRKFSNHLVISAGNLSAGGTGKTPLAIALAGEFRRRGVSVLVCLRGYRGKQSGGLLVADSSGIKSSAAAAGDEAILIGLRLLNDDSTGTPFAVATGSDRRMLIEQFGDLFSVVILDDAFQNPSVDRDFDLVLIDATVAPANAKLLPCGRFREGIDALDRAGTVILTRSDQATARADEWNEILKKRFPALPVWRAGLRVSGLRPLGSEGRPPLPPGTRVGAFCGIGNPESFFRSLQTAGYLCARKKSFRDHHVFSRKDLMELSAWDLPLVTTEKDGARLSPDDLSPSLFPRGLWTLPLDLRFLEGGDIGGLVEKLLAARGKEFMQETV